MWHRNIPRSLSFLIVVVAAVSVLVPRFLAGLTPTPASSNFPGKLTPARCPALLKGSVTGSFALGTGSSHPIEFELRRLYF